MVSERFGARFDTETLERIESSAGKKDQSASDWLREAANVALEIEEMAAKEPLRLIEIAKAVQQTTQSLERIQHDATDLKKEIEALSRSVAIERAADRIMQEQILRMAVRSAYIIAQMADDAEVGGSMRDLFHGADEAFRDGIEIAEKGMREARADLARTLSVVSRS